MLKLLCFLLFFSISVFSQPLKPKNICGISPALKRYGVHNSEKILEGPKSKLGDWPWVVSLIPVNCTATLISDKWILTAAHCVTKQPENTIINGTIIYAGTIKKSKGKNITVEKIFVYPKWNWTSGFNDIALIKVSKVKFNDKIRPICLSSKLKNSPKNNSIAVGFGRHWNGHEATKTEFLHEDIVPIRIWQHCKDLKHIMPINPKKEICAGRGLHSTWLGDSGGPLMEIINNRFYEIGITSWGSPGKDDQINQNSDFENIFSFIPAYCNWIAKTTNGYVKCE